MVSLRDLVTEDADIQAFKPLEMTTEEIAEYKENFEELYAVEELISNAEITLGRLETMATFEDSDANAAYYEVLVESLGYTVEEAGAASSFIETVKGNIQLAVSKFNSSMSKVGANFKKSKAAVNNKAIATFVKNMESNEEIVNKPLSVKASNALRAVFAINEVKSVADAVKAAKTGIISASDSVDFANQLTERAIKGESVDISKFKPSASIDKVIEAATTDVTVIATLSPFGGKVDSLAITDKGLGIHTSTFKQVKITEAFEGTNKDILDILKMVGKETVDVEAEFKIIKEGYEANLLKITESDLSKKDAASAISVVRRFFMMQVNALRDAPAAILTLAKSIGTPSFLSGAFGSFLRASSVIGIYFNKIQVVIGSFNILIGIAALTVSPVYGMALLAYGAGSILVALASTYVNKKIIKKIDEVKAKAGEA